MKTKKESKGKTKEKPAKISPTADAGRLTIKWVVMELISANAEVSNHDMIQAVKARFPKSAFDARHAAWYRSQARKGLLTGTPVAIPSQAMRSKQQSE